MITFLKRLVLLVILMGFSDQLSAAEFLYLAAGNTIAVKAIDQSSGKLSTHQTLKLDGAGPITDLRRRESVKTEVKITLSSFLIHGGHHATAHRHVHPGVEQEAGPTIPDPRSGTVGQRLRRRQAGRLVQGQG